MRTAVRGILVVALMVAAALVPAPLDAAAADTTVVMATQTIGQVVADEPRQQVFVSAVEANAVYVFGYDGALVTAITGIAAPRGMLLDGTTLYVAASNSGAIERIDVTTLTRGTALATGIPGLQALAMAAGRIWTVSPCGQWTGALKAIDPATGAVSTYAAGTWLSYCGWLMSDPLNPNRLIGWSQGLSPPTVERWDVSGASPSLVTSRRIEYAGSIRNVTPSHDGTRLYPASGAPYDLHEIRTDTLGDSGMVYDAEPYPTATASSPARGGLAAVGIYGAYSDDVWVYAAGNPADLKYKANVGSGVQPRGLAFSGDGTKLFVVTEPPYQGNASFKMLEIAPPPLGLGHVSPPAPAPQLSVSPTSHNFGGRRVSHVSNPETVDVSNVGGAALTVGELLVTGPGVGSFSTETDCLDAPLRPGESCQVEVRHAPSEPGDATAVLQIVSDGGKNTVQLTGVGSTGFVLGAAQGGAIGFGDAAVGGAVPGPLNSPVVGLARTPSGDGVWLAGGDGGVFTFGDAVFHGSTGGMTLSRPIVGMASTPSGNGYWLVAEDGGVFSFGDAGFHGSTGGMTLNAPVVGMASTPSGDGYWLVAEDGGVFSFGDAGFHGSTGGLFLPGAIVGLAATPSGGGYAMVDEDGRIHDFGDAPAQGSMSSVEIDEGSVVGFTPTPMGAGYWVVTSDGTVVEFGDAPDLGDLPGEGITVAVVGIVATS